MMRDIDLDELCVADGPETGDVVLVSGSGAWGALVGRVQRRLLSDLGVPEAECAGHAAYTHAGLWMRMGTGSGWLLEMSWPECRLTPVRLAGWRAGTLVKIRRPLLGGADAPLRRRLEAASRGVRDLRTAYPLRELLGYWVWSLQVGKLWLGRRWREVFSDASRDVCSGSVFRWLRGAGLMAETLTAEDGRPEAWYPGRLSWEPGMLRTVGAFRIA